MEHDTICHFDMGAAVYGLVLAAWSRGLGSVINSQGIMQSSVVHEHAVPRRPDYYDLYRDGLARL